MIRKIFDEALSDGKCYEVLTHLCTQIGPRLSGSPGAARAVDYTRSVMEKEKFDKVSTQECMVPHWVRGNPSEVFVVSGGKNDVLPSCALGGSVSSGGKAIIAEVIEVKQLDDLEKLGKAKIEGKIVFFSRPMKPTHIQTFEAYGGCVDQRGSGAAKAAQYGAVGVIVRSMSLREDDFPHTGGMHYDTLYKKIPALAISTAAATRLSKLMAANKPVKISLTCNSETLPDTLSHNVIGQLTGTEKPGEYLITGGHLDAWDNGQGAHDDGAGCVQSIEALRILKAIGYRPRHSMRAVMFMNEENGLRGGLKYAEVAEKTGEKHLAAIESDRGGFTPRGFTIEGEQDWVDKINGFRKLLEPYGLNEFKKGGGGADIGPLKKSGTLCLGYIPDSQRYFDFHHAGSDVIENVNKRELEMGAASIAAMLYLLDKYGFN